jgi:hypothetical protein
MRAAQQNIWLIQQKMAWFYCTDDDKLMSSFSISLAYLIYLFNSSYFSGVNVGLGFGSSSFYSAAFYSAF